MVITVLLIITEGDALLSSTEADSLFRVESVVTSKPGDDGVFLLADVAGTLIPLSVMT